MFRKLISLFLVFLLIFSFAGCDEKPDDNTTSAPVTSEEVPVSEKKIALLVPAGAQFNELKLASQEIASAYGDKILVKEFDNHSNLADNKKDLVSLTKELAADKSIGAVIFTKAARLTNEAILMSQQINPELVFGCIEPEASTGNLAGISNFVFCTDWSKAAADIVANAKAKGAEYFLMTSFNRHISGSSSVDRNSLLAATLKSALSSECTKQGIKFVFHNAPDPISAGGTKVVIKNIRESIARYKSDGKIAGSNVALFTTDYYITKEMIEIAKENNYIYASPSFPTAFNGIGEAIADVKLPAKVEDYASYNENLRNTAGSLPRAIVYNFALESVFIEAAVHLAFDILAGKVNDDNISQKAEMRLTDAATNEAFTVKKFGGYNNVYAAYLPAYEAIN